MVACLESVQSIGVRSCSHGGGRTAAGCETEYASRLAEVDRISQLQQPGDRDKVASQIRHEEDIVQSDAVRDLDFANMSGSEDTATSHSDRSAVCKLGQEPVSGVIHMF